jgi:hypothetical protein
MNNKNYYKEYINEQLKISTPKALDNIEQLFENKEFLKNIMIGDMELAYCSIAMSIYQEEKKKNIEKSILSFNRNMKELENMITGLKFLIWRFQFDRDCEQATVEEIEKYLANYDLSDVALKHVMGIAYIKG